MLKMQVHHICINCIIKSSVLPGQQAGHWATALVLAALELYVPGAWLKSKVEIIRYG